MRIMQTSITGLETDKKKIKIQEVIFFIPKFYIIYNFLSHFVRKWLSRKKRARA